MVEFNGNDARSRGWITVQIPAALVGSVITAVGLGGGWIYHEKTRDFPGGKTPADVYELIQKLDAEDQKLLNALERDLAILENRVNWHLQGHSSNRTNNNSITLPQARTNPE